MANNLQTNNEICDQADEIASLKAAIKELSSIIRNMDDIQSIAFEQIGYLADMVGVAAESPHFGECPSAMTYCVMKSLTDIADQAKNNINCLAIKRREVISD